MRSGVLTPPDSVHQDTAIWNATGAAPSYLSCFDPSVPSSPAQMRRLPMIRPVGLAAG